MNELTTESCRYIEIYASTDRDGKDFIVMDIDKRSITMYCPLTIPETRQLITMLQRAIVEAKKETK